MAEEYEQSGASEFIKGKLLLTYFRMSKKKCENRFFAHKYHSKIHMEHAGKCFGMILNTRAMNT